MFKQPNFNKVLVLDTNRKPLMPCYPARARKLLTSGRASVFRRYPFTIILHDRTVDAKLNVSHKYCKTIHLMDGYSYA